MLINSDKIIIKYAAVDNLEDLKLLPSLKPFDENVCEFLNALSGKLLKDSYAKKFSDIVTFAFFIRKSNIMQLKKMYNTDGRIGRGLSFHIAPSNVPINFAYTFAAGLLAGNSCIVRASSKGFEQTDIICDALNQLAGEDSNSALKYLAVVSYEREKEITDELSELCDVRIIWGGDNTVAEIRKSVLPPRSTEITFADRYSICVLNAEYIMKLSDMKAIVQGFYNDTYLYDQNACSSPRLLYWLGDMKTVHEAKEKFWAAVHEFAGQRYKIEPVIAVDKLTAEYRAAIELDGIVIEKRDDSLFNRIEVKELTPKLMDFICPGGSFMEYESTSIEDLEKMVNKKFQTMSYVGCNAKELAQWVIDKGLSGIDRIVPIGKTADFALTWDGYDLIEEMTRKVFLQCVL